MMLVSVLFHKLSWKHCKAPYMYVTSEHLMRCFTISASRDTRLLVHSGFQFIVQPCSFNDYRLQQWVQSTVLKVWEMRGDVFHDFKLTSCRNLKEF